MPIEEHGHFSPTRVRFFYGYIIVAVAFIIQVLMFGPRGSFGIFFKPLEAEFAWNRATISGAFSASTIMQGFAGILMGGLNDKIGPRIVMSVCSILLGLGFCLMSLTNTVWQLYLFYAIFIGISMGGVYIPIMSTVARWFVKRRNIMTGIVLAGGGTGSLIVPPLVNWIIMIFGWRTAYLLMGSVIFVIIIICAQLLKRDPAMMGQSPYGGNEAVERNSATTASGLSPKESIRTWQFWMVAAIAFCFGLCLLTVMVHIVPHLTDLGISAALSANILAVMGGALLVGSLSVGAIADRIGVRPAFSICFILLSTVGFLLMPVTDVIFLSCIPILISLGGGGAATLESTLVAELFGLKAHGLVLGLVGLGYTLGAAVGPFIAGYIYDVNNSYQMAFVATTATGITGLVLMSILRPVKKQDII